MLLDKEIIMEKETRTQLARAKDILKIQNQSLGEDFPLISEKDIKKFNRNQDIIEAIEKVLEEKK